MNTVTFHGFANGRSAFAEVMPSVTSSDIARAAKKSGKLASKLIVAEYRDADSGQIFAGDRCVAHFTVSDLPKFLLPRQPHRA